MSDRPRRSTVALTRGSGVDGQYRQPSTGIAPSVLRRAPTGLVGGDAEGTCVAI
ncbi:hypothetical protein [Streptomyces sp. NPDC001980]|uniref:hypothetical protein n=1 Tax=Streptomyces sp. NPDC001980 TaxID=3157126 RepID=UPI003319C3E6